MTALTKRRCRVVPRSAFSSTCLACHLLLLASIASSDNVPSTATTDTLGGIDNKRFAGHMVAGSTAEGEGSEDIFIFDNGEFVSQSCLEWGFTPSPYWVRLQADGLHFLAELESPDHGNMRFEGVYRDQQINGTVYWRKERWYWTAEQEYRFSGRFAGEPE